MAEIEKLEEVVEDGEGEREPQTGGEGRQEREEEGEVVGEEVMIEDLPESEEIETARAEEETERCVQFQSSWSTHDPVQ